MVGIFKRTCYTVLGVVALGCFAPSFAKAQHIVTDAEAGKLTLSSLTAAPVRHAYHSRRHVSKASKARIRTVAYRTHSKKSRSSLVHKVSYKSKTHNKIKAKSAVYRVTNHKKVHSRRHRS